MGKLEIKWWYRNLLVFDLVCAPSLGQVLLFEFRHLNTSYFIGFHPIPKDSSLIFLNTILRRTRQSSIKYIADDVTL